MGASTARATTPLLGAAVIGFNFGGNFALFPAATADYFGSRRVGANYGWIFTAYGGILGPVMASVFRDFGADRGLVAWLPAFLFGAGVCAIAAVRALLLPSAGRSVAPRGRR